MSSKNKSNYDVEKLLQAASDVMAGRLSYRAAADTYGVPRSTIVDVVKRKYSNLQSKTELTKEEEKILADWMLRLSRRGFPVNKRQLLDSVELYLTKNNRKTCFTHNRPGRDWYNRFLKRHPEISIRMSNNVSKYRAAVTEENIRQWFKEVCTKY